MVKTRMLLTLVGMLLWACGGGGSEPPVEKEIAPSAAVQPEVVKSESAPPAKPAEAVADKPADEGSPIPQPTGDTPAVADVLKLKFEGGKRKAVTFPHKLHVDLEKKKGENGCDHCHHKAKELRAFRGCTSAGCHDKNTEKKLRVDFAFHKLCRTCHKKALAEQPANEKLKKIKSCKGCHAG